MAKQMIRIGAASGFWGDRPDAALEQVRKGPLDYLVMDYLAEVTMSILQKLKSRDAERGYAHDFITVMEAILPEIKEREICVLSNAGGANPASCKDALLETAESLGISNLKVALVDGDDLLPNLPQLTASGHPLKHIETGEPITSIMNSITSANAYLSSDPVVDALAEKPDVVITGRVIDAGLAAAPMIHEFGWARHDYNKRAAGIVGGHLIECGTQSTGGNYTDWQEVDNFYEIGFPVLEAFADGHLELTKHPGTGGLVNLKSVKEQLIYEIQNPAAYLTPDCVADFTSLKLEATGENRVSITNISGSAPPEQYKVSASYRSGYQMVATLLYPWPDALAKAQKSGEILKKRALKLGLKIDRWSITYLGYNACSNRPVDDEALGGEHHEIQLRVAAASTSKEDLELLGKEVIPLVLTGPPGATGYGGGRPRAKSVFAYWPALIDRDAVKPRISVFEL